MRALLIATAASLLATVGVAAPPLAGSWNITPSGSAASSGELLFRVSPARGEPSEVTVSVRNGSDDVAIARSIRQALSAQLPRVYRIEQGEGANVLLSDPRGKPSFSVELLDSDVDSLRVSVRNIEPAATPTVPAQAAPAITLPPPTPAQPGAATPPTRNPEEAMPPANAPPMGPQPAPAPTEPVATPPADSAQPATPPPAGTQSPPEAGSSPVAPPNATPPPK